MRNDIVVAVLSRRLADITASVGSASLTDPFDETRTTDPAVVEEALRRLMVRDRRMIDRGESFDPNEITERLTIVAAQANTVPDLRFLDALNYYFELPFAFPEAVLKPYAAALKSHVERPCE